ncbi:MAG: 1,4-dihydroxy-2-naphthoate octaprenyltransferase [Deltaproteobacteria bacterium]|nr:1,4-dihydroxy-2-naphthoate octaprenyltransferase [Deltaproteobacteria bacterium]MBW2153858.1 1,4-dihydroxy-2-naphthoate octaprenyltransferase [Deltaproteobacteria bacterium]
MGIYRNWLLASRPWSFSMTAISVSVGAVMAAVDGNFSLPLYLFTLATMVILHAATNLINDYYDVLSGIDHLAVSTAQYRPHPLLEGKLKPHQVRSVSYMLYAIVIVAGLYLAATRGWVILAIGLIGVISSFTYTAPPFKYKYNALGEFSVFLMWGPLMVEGAYFVQRQALSEPVFWVSLPLGALVALVLLANNLRDIDHDREKGIRTLPIMIGRLNGIRLYILLMVLSYLAVLWMSLKGPLQVWSLIVLISSPLAYRLSRQVHHSIPLDGDAQTARLDTVFGVLLVTSLILGGIF